MAASKLTKTQFIAALSEGSGLDKKAVNALLDALTKLVKDQLSAGGPGELTIPNLIKLKTKDTPAQPEKLKKALAGVKRVLVVEQSHSGQFLRYLRAEYELPAQVKSLRRPGPLPFRPAEIAAALS